MIVPWTSLIVSLIPIHFDPNDSEEVPFSIEGLHLGPVEVRLEELCHEKKHAKSQTELDRAALEAIYYQPGSESDRETLRGVRWYCEPGSQAPERSTQNNSKRDP